MVQSNQQLRLLHINSADSWAGGEVHAFLLCRELTRRGHYVVLACRPGSAIDRKFRECQLPVINLPLKGAGDIGSARQLARYCRQQSLAIIHAHLGRDYWLAIFARVQYSGLKTVFTRHLLIPLKRGFAHRWLYRLVDRVVTVSKAVEEVVRAAELVPEAKLATIYNGIDTEAYASAPSGVLRAELKIAPNTPIIGIVGHISPHKGQDVFIRSIPGIAAKRPDTVFVIVGDDFRQGEYIAELRKLAGELGVEKQVFFLGLRQDVPQVMKDLDIFVLASWNEPFGLVIAEAMAAGKPVVATAAGGAQEIVIPGETGLLFPGGDHTALASCICRLLEDEALATRLGQSGAARAARWFSLAAMVDKTVEVYHQLLKERSGGR